MFYSIAFQCSITVSLYVLQQCFLFSFNVSLCITAVHSSALFQWHYVLIQCPSKSYSSACHGPTAMGLYAFSSGFQCPISLSQYVRQQCLPVSCCSVFHCPTAVLAIVLLQCLSMSYINAFHCPLAVTFYVLQLLFQRSYYSVSLCPTAVVASGLKQCLSVSY